MNKAVTELYSLDEYVDTVANAKFRPRDGINFEGLYTSGIITSEDITNPHSKHVIKPLDNSILYELLEDGKITCIDIYKPDVGFGITDHLKFDYKNGGIFDLYEGFYYSKNDELITFMGGKWEDAEPEGEGWAYHNDQDYYVERITDCWYYYKMLF